MREENAGFLQARGKDGMFMDFLIQKTGTGVGLEERMLMDSLRLYDSYTLCSLEEMEGSPVRDMVPVGSIEFVEKHLSLFHGIPHMSPMELPRCLRTDSFVSRQYRVCGFDGLPASGRWFIKRADRLKVFGRLMEDHEVREIREDRSFTKDGLYVVSSPVDIRSEWRAYISRGRVLAVTNYDGDPFAVPDKEIIYKAMWAMEMDRKHVHPRSYTIDVAVLEDGRTELLEVHPFACVGLYTSLWGTELPVCYGDGYGWYRDANWAVES